MQTSIKVIIGVAVTGAVLTGGYFIAKSICLNKVARQETEMSEVSAGEKLDAATFKENVQIYKDAYKKMSLLKLIGRIKDNNQNISAA